MSLLYDVKGKKKKRGGGGKKKRISHVSGGSFHGATEKMGTRFSLERCFRAQRLFRENFQRNALNLLIRTGEKKNTRRRSIFII